MAPGLRVGPLRWSSSLALAAALSVLAAPAWAQAPGRAPAAPTAEGKLRSDLARDLGRGEFELVVKRADQALTRPLEAEDAAHVQLLRGQALLALGQTERARQAFAVAAQRDPTVELDAAHASPDAVRLLEKVRGELPATLVVLVKAGDDADVAVDDKSLGPAPLQTQVPGGVHVVLAKGADGRTTRVEAQVPPGRKVVLELELTKHSHPAAGAPKASPAPVSRGAQGDAPTKTTVAGPVRSADAPTVVASSAGGVSAEVAGVSQPLTAQVQRGPGPASIGLWVGGGAVVLAGAVALWQSAVDYDRLVNSTLPALPPGEGREVMLRGQTLLAVGWVGVGAGLAAAAAGGVLWWMDSRAPVLKVGAAVTPTGGWVGVTGRTQ